MTMNLSDLINQMIDFKNEKARLEQQVKDVQKQIAQLESDIMHAMNEAGTTKAASEAGHSATMKKSLQPTITDWDQFYAYVTSTKNFDLLQKRLSSTAFRDRWEAGEEIPGSSSVELWGLTVTQSRK